MMVNANGLSNVPFNASVRGLAILRVAAFTIALIAFFDGPSAKAFEVDFVLAQAASGINGGAGGNANGVGMINGGGAQATIHREWSAQPQSGDWSNAANWAQNIVPNSSDVTVNFGPTSQTNVTLALPGATVGQMSFTGTGPGYQFSIGYFTSLVIAGGGIGNSATNAPTFITSGAMAPWNAPGNGILSFSGNASAANANIINNNYGKTTFSGNSSAASANITVNPGGAVEFHDNSTAANSTIAFVGCGSCYVEFYERSTAGNATIDNNNGVVIFYGNQVGATAGNALITSTHDGITDFAGGWNGVGTNSGGNSGTGFVTAENATLISSTGGENRFKDQATAGNSTIVANDGGITRFMTYADAGNASIIANQGGQTIFEDDSNAATATLITNAGGQTIFKGTATGPEATAITNAGGLFDFSHHTTLDVSMGSINGDGTYYLGGARLTVGENGANSSLNGTILGDMGSQLIKDGIGTLVLNGVGYNPGTIEVSGGTLIIGDIGHQNASISSTTYIDAGGTLSGIGTIGGDLFNNGTVRPGVNTIGVLTVGGNFSQSAQGKTVIEVSPTSASKLAVGGTASLAGEAHIVYDPGTYSARSYQILTANNIVGTFDSLSGATPSGMVQNIIYSSNEADLVIAVPPASVTTVAAPANTAIV